MILHMILTHAHAVDTTGLQITDHADLANISKLKADFKVISACLFKATSDYHKINSIILSRNSINFAYYFPIRLFPVFLLRKVLC